MMIGLIEETKKKLKDNKILIKPFMNIKKDLIGNKNKSLDIH